MKPRALYQLSIHCRANAEEPVVAIIEHLLKLSPTVFVDEKSQRRTISVYGPDLPWSKAARALVAQGLHALRKAGLATGPLRVEAKRLPPEDWAESWKRHFKPLRIGSQLLVRPPWSKDRGSSGQVVVTLNPGLAFGTGQHPTTAFCLRQVVAARPLPGQTRSFLDLGTGSGLLAIAAVKLGYSPVHGLDNDPISIAIARANAQANEVSTLAKFKRADLKELGEKSPRRYDLICANLTSDLLLAERARILARLKPGGRLVLAGILTAQFPGVAQSYGRAGLKLVRRRTEKEWTSGAFENRRR